MKVKKEFAQVAEERSYNNPLYIHFNRVLDGHGSVIAAVVKKTVVVDTPGSRAAEMLAQYLTRDQWIAPNIKKIELKP
jgi:hypothetical protein